MIVTDTISSVPRQKPLGGFGFIAEAINLIGSLIAPKTTPVAPPPPPPPPEFHETDFGKVMIAASVVGVLGLGVMFALKKPAPALKGYRRRRRKGRR